MRTLKRKSKWRPAQRKTSANFRDCAICTRSSKRPDDPSLHLLAEPHSGEGGPQATQDQVICYCDTNAGTLPLLSSNCYRSFCTSGDNCPPTFRCLNIDRNLRANNQCPCDVAPASNGDHNFFFRKADLGGDPNNNCVSDEDNNNQNDVEDEASESDCCSTTDSCIRLIARKAAEDAEEHPKLGDACLRCCVRSTQPPPRLYCFRSGTCCVSSELSVNITSSTRLERRRGSAPRRRSTKRSQAPPRPLRNPKAIQPWVRSSTRKKNTIISNPLYREVVLRHKQVLPQLAPPAASPGAPPEAPPEAPPRAPPGAPPASLPPPPSQPTPAPRKDPAGAESGQTTPSVDAKDADTCSLSIGRGDDVPAELFRQPDSVFKNLTQLDVSENTIEVLDLSALAKLQTLQCSRNSLRELTVNGRHLTSLIAGNNQLRTLTANPVPQQLEHLDVSYNRLAALPGWIGGCVRLRALFASHNELAAVPGQLLGGQLPQLHTLQLSYNQLQQLPPASAPPRAPLALHQLFLQSNRLAALPSNLFTAATRLRVLNVSNNRLEELPPASSAPDSPLPLDKLYLTANCLGDAALRSLAAFRRLRTLHAAYNHISVLPDSCIASWRDLEELVLSGNQLRHLPENVLQLRHLRVLRVHSNQLRHSPCFAKMTASLRVLDLSHNQLDRVSLASLAPPQLQFLDLSCNSRLHVDPRQFSLYRSQRSLSLVDVSGLNRCSLPTSPTQPPQTPWAVGFSETPGLRERLYISQLRLPAFCGSEGLFGVFDGGGESSLPATLVKAVPRILLEERAVTETAADYLKYTLLSAHRELRAQGQQCGVCATLLHVTPRGTGAAAGRYVLRVASVGEARALLARADGTVTLTREHPANGANRHPLESAVRSQLGYTALFPLVLPDPHVVELELRDSDDFLVLANKRLWEVVSEQEAVQEVRAAASPILAAKRLQDVAQSYGCEDNLSVLVLRLGTLTAPAPVPVVNPAPTQRRARRESGQHGAQGRSSPSGQSDQASSEFHPHPAPRRPQPGSGSGTGSGPLFKAVMCRVDNGYNSHRGSGGSDSGDTSGSGSGCGSGCGSGTGSDRSHLSEEQFRCWEYMLEQNTQLLFDKELDTLSRSFTRRPMSRALPLLGLGGGRALSSSSPHLASPAPPPASAPFLSRHFGSARSLTCSLTPGSRRVGVGPGGRLLHTGPNAAYFGSLQRLMPYNLEYDFDIIHERGERGEEHDSLEQDGRMRKYWDVATTEL